MWTSRCSSGLLVLMSSLMSSEPRSKVYYDYNYRVLPPVQRISDRSYRHRDGTGVHDNNNQESGESIPVLSWLLPSPPSSSSSDVVLDYYDPVEEFGERQDPAVAAGVSLALMGMAASAAFTGAVIAPVISMGMERMIDTVGHLDIRMPVFPKDVFNDDYPEYQYEEYNSDNEEFETEIIDVKKRSKNGKKN